MDFITIMEWVGTVAFAVSGAVVAIEKGLDHYGIGFLAIITAIGGGIMRDLLINKDLPTSLADPSYAIVSVATAVVVIVFYKRIDKVSHLVSLADGIGLAAFTAIGCKVAVLSGHPGFYVTITLAVLTGTFGGVLRDVFVHEIPRCFRREVYAMASIGGAVVFDICYLYMNLNVGLSMYICCGVTLAIRLVTMYKGIHLKTVKI